MMRDEEKEGEGSHSVVRAVGFCEETEVQRDTLFCGFCHGA